MRNKFILLALITVLFAGCAKSTNAVTIKEVYIPQKTIVSIIDCEYTDLEDSLNKINQNDIFYLTNVISTQNKIINKLKYCLERQWNEIRSKQ